MSSEQKIKVPIQGMHCKSCEILLEGELAELPGVSRADVNHQKGEADIYYDDEKPKLENITEAVEKAGYTVGVAEKEGIVSKSMMHYKDLGIALIFLLALYYILKGLGVTSFNISTSSNVLSIPLVLLVGLTAGVSTCMALVGGLVLGLSAKHSKAHPEATRLEKFEPHIYFNVGRIISYAILGGLLGTFGSIFQLSGAVLGVITIIIGVVMLMMGLQLIQIFPWANKLKFTLPKAISRRLGINKTREYSSRNSMIVGALTFFLPCGFTQAMQVYAVGTGNFWAGAMVMAAFALGTAPGLLGVGGLASSFKGVAARRFFKVAGLAVIAFAFFNISNGLTVSGVSSALSQTNSASTTSAAADPNVTIVNGVQIVKMNQSASGYEPSTFTIVKDMPVKWVINAKEAFSCTSTILLPKKNIQKNLQIGENVVEFMPDQAGPLTFSCSMGMYNGSFNVVDKNAPRAAITTPAATPVAAVAKASGSMCGGSGGGCGCGMKMGAK